MTAWPLLAHPAPDSIVAWRHGAAITRQTFLAEVRQLAAQLPAGRHLLNLCGDRYAFSVVLAAAMVSGRICLLPSSHAPASLRQIQAGAPDTFAVFDRDDPPDGLPGLRYPERLAVAAHTEPVPQIDIDQGVAVLFTSGSTGQPQAHRKTWGSLVQAAQAEATRLGLAPGSAVVGTVPPQHMYGLEATVLMAWINSCALCAAHPFYPADIAAALAAVPAPRTLVSTPVHLRALLEADPPLPAIDLFLSATAPLTARIAQSLESKGRTRLMEIYGSTETAAMATRRTAQTAIWSLLPGIRLEPDGEGESLRAEGGHIAPPTRLNDRIERLDATQFLLHGRLNDLVNIAGKRHSLASLNAILTAIPGVRDGVFHMPAETDPEHVTRLAACVVAPELDAPRLLAALRERIDPVFLPRPLRFVDALPRNSSGKLPLQALEALFHPSTPRNS